MMAAMGIAFAGSAWIPFTIISKEIRRPKEAGLQDAQDDIAATVVGIHNMAIAAPQIVAVFGSSLVFFVAQYEGDKLEGGGMEVWLLRSGIFSTLAAACVIKTLPED